MSSLVVEAIRAQVRTLDFVRGTAIEDMALEPDADPVLAITPVPITAGR